MADKAAINTPIFAEDLGIGVRAQRVLEAHRIVYTSQLLAMTVCDLALLHGCGPTTFNAILSALDAHGLELKTNKTPSAKSG